MPGATLGAGVVGYRVDYADSSEWESPPTEEDRLGVPFLEQPAVSAVVDELKLAERTPAGRLAELERYFGAFPSYSTTLVDAAVEDPRASTPVGRFLLGHRTGHCEYFATAAVLLRQSGVPARYATGYSVAASEVEGAGSGGAGAARPCLGSGVDRRCVEGIRSTSPGALDLGEGPGNWTGRLGGMWSDLRFAFSRWWWLGEKRILRHLYWGIVPLLVLLLWRLRRVREVIPGGGSETGRVPRLWPGLH